MRWLGMLCLVVAMQSAGAQPVLRFCAEDEDSHPWLLKGGRGLNMVMLGAVEERLALRILVERQPWKRCLQSLRDNLVDGAFKASFSAERQAFAHYPLRNGRVDEERRMLTESYHLFRRKGTAVHWDGQQLQVGERPVGAQAGFSIVPWLQAKGLKVDEGTRQAEAVLTKLVRERIDAAALQTQQAEHLIRKHPEWAGLIERLEPPLVAKPYYLLLSRALVLRDGALAERIWDAVGAVRESPAYQQAVAEFD